MNAEQSAWIEAAPNREIVFIREPAPCGESVTTKWLENGAVWRQDVEIIVSPDALAIKSETGKVA